MSKAQSIARLRMLREKGVIYAAYSGYCDWIKIGFTTKPVATRIEKLNHAYAPFAPFSLIGTTPGYHRTEQTFHAVLRPLRLNRTAVTSELYPASRSLVSFVNRMLAFDQTPPIHFEAWREMRAWAQRAAAHPLNRVEAEVCFDRFRRERRSRDPLLAARAA